MDSAANGRQAAPRAGAVVLWWRKVMRMQMRVWVDESARGVVTRGLAAAVVAGLALGAPAAAAAEGPEARRASESQAADRETGNGSEQVLGGTERLREESTGASSAGVFFAKPAIRTHGVTDKESPSQVRSHGAEDPTDSSRIRTHGAASTDASRIPTQRIGEVRDGGLRTHRLGEPPDLSRIRTHGVAGR